MYRWFVRRNVRAAFAALSNGDMSLVNNMAPDVHHSFPGRGALGGQRSTRDDVVAWLARLYRIMPGRRALNKAVLRLAARTGQGARLGVRAHAEADLGGKPCPGWWKGFLVAR